ncbi:MAG: hypothetical protein A2V65_10420 [Deltaproteobacteria bacterium RBG_13_49_15]|nr:MAG: hypothetical protein A2V65_10420 [Deltaproteobacteria bacterium RBG_13_49_15]
MPRQARIDAPGALHHIITRGIESKIIFNDSLDHNVFLDRLKKILEETETPCFAWALMPNHVHLLLRTGIVPISTVMRRLLTGYAQYFNRRHERSGHLFQNRYKSILCEENAYLLELVRYIHLNPLRAAVVDSMSGLNIYPYCGHSVIMRNIRRNWQDSNYVLSLFGEKEEIARKSYCRFISKGVSQGRRPELVGGGMIRSAGGWHSVTELRNNRIRINSDERILGSSDFVKSVLGKADERYEKKTEAASMGITLERLIRSVSKQADIEEKLIVSSSRRRAVASARSIICSLALDRLGEKGVNVARRLNISESSVSKLANKGRKDPDIKKYETELYRPIS